MGPGAFSVEAFAQRVQALISDDRAVMERLIRFAQAHDLLKKNAKRAQKETLGELTEANAAQSARALGNREQTKTNDSSPVHRVVSYPEPW